MCLYVQVYYRAFLWDLATVSPVFIYVYERGYLTLFKYLGDLFKVGFSLLNSSLIRASLGFSAGGAD